MKVTLDGIKAKIKGETYLVLPDGRTTLCQLEMENGYTINGYSACVDPAEFNRDTGRKYAFESAVSQIWPLEGYLLAEEMLKTERLRKQLVDRVEIFNKKPLLTQTSKGKANMAARKRGSKK